MKFSLLVFGQVAVHGVEDSLNLLQTRISGHSDQLALLDPIASACVDNACETNKIGGAPLEWFTVNGTTYMYKAWGRGIKPCKDANGAVIEKCYTIGCGGDGDMHIRYNWGCLGKKYLQTSWPALQQKECTVRHNENAADWQPWGLATFAQSFDKKVVVQIYQCAHYCSPSNPMYVGADGVNVCPMQSSMTMVGVKAGSTVITWGTSRNIDQNACTTKDKSTCGKHRHLTDTWVRIGTEVIHPNSASSGWSPITKKVQDPELGEVLIVIRGWDIKISGGASHGNFFLTESVMANGLIESLIAHMQAPLLEMDPNGASICTNVFDMDGGPNPGQSDGSLVVVPVGSPEFTLIFTHLELDSRCTACVWGRLGQMRDKRGNLIVGAAKAFAGVPFPPTEDECKEIEQYPGSCSAYYEPRTCKNPYVPGQPAPTPEDKCKETNCSFNFSQRLCAPLKGGPPEDNAYHNCMFDFCAGCDKDVYDAYDQVENFEHPKPHCVQNSGNCNEQDTCENAFTMSLADGPSQNNLGGAGPDSGPAEIRYSKAGLYNGKSVDLVVTADGYTPKNPEKNGAMGNFGRINVKCGANVAFDFKLVDSETGEAVEVPKVAFSVYDMDEGKRGKGRVKVAACGAAELFTSSPSELTTAKRAEGCFSAESSKQGVKGNEPTNPLLLTEDHMSRSASFAFQDVSSVSFDVSMGKCSGARNLQFAVRPTVACAGLDYSP